MTIIFRISWSGLDRNETLKRSLEDPVHCNVVDKNQNYPDWLEIKPEIPFTQNPQGGQNLYITNETTNVTIKE